MGEENIDQEINDEKTETDNSDEMNRKSGELNNNQDNSQELIPTEIGRIKPRELNEEMQTSYLDYAMSVIVSRALPDVEMA